MSASASVLCHLSVQPVSPDLGDTSVGGSPVSVLFCVMFIPFSVFSGLCFCDHPPLQESLAW